MRDRLVKLAATAVLAAGIAGATPALADMGTSPVGPGGMYLNLFGGYVNSDGPETVGHLTTPGAVAAPNPHVTVGAEEGGFAGGAAGYVLGGTPLFGLQNMRIEAANLGAHSRRRRGEGGARLGSHL